jgi:hypothetical protein
MQVQPHTHTPSPTQPPTPVEASALRVKTHIKAGVYPPGPY